MIRIRSLVLGAVTTLTLSACGSDEGTGTKGTGGSATTSTGGSTNSTTGGSATTGTGGSTSTGTGGSATAKGGTTSTGGSTAATGGSTATGNNCQSACTKLKAANCGDLAQTDCSTACTGGTACVAESDAYYGCVATTGTVSCSTATATTPSGAQVAGCSTSERALDICSTCLAGDPATESTCSTCSKASCCTQRKAYLSASDVDGFYTCASAATCNTQACYDGCVTMYPNAAKAYDALDACENKGCVSTCLCGENANDNACVACVKKSCCDDFGALINSADYAAFNKCLGACADGDQACFDACVTASPVAGAAYDQLGSNCLTTTCSAECTAP